MLGDEHPNTLTATANLAELYERQGTNRRNRSLREHWLWDVGTGRAEPQHAVDDEKVGGPVPGRRQVRAGRVALPSASWKAGVERSEMSIPTRWRAQALGWPYRSLLRNVGMPRPKPRSEPALQRTTKIAAPDSWNRYHCQSLLGASLAGQKKFAEAEPLLIAGYEGMVQREATIAAPDRADLSARG